MKGPRWLLLPFGAAFGGSREKQKHNERPNARLTGADGGVDAISKPQRKEDFRNESEEHIVEDYNAPM